MILKVYFFIKHEYVLFRLTLFRHIMMVSTYEFPSRYGQNATLTQQTITNNTLRSY